MASMRYKLDAKKPPKLSPEERARLDAMMAAEIEHNALSDDDNPPMTEEELARAVSAREVSRAREKTKLSQSEFAARFRINVARLRDLERGRYVAEFRPCLLILRYRVRTEIVQKALADS